MAKIDKQVFEQRGALGCSDSHYVFCQTTCCGDICVVDDELLRLHVHPDEPARTLALWEPHDECPFCGKRDWDFIHCAVDDDAPARWRWACVAA